VLVRNAIPLAIVTVFMSISLFLSYNIKYVIFPVGFPFILLFTWGLVSVPLVPILLLLEFVVLSNLLGSADIASRSRELTFTLIAILMGAVSIIVFLIVRNMS
jgi:hypothetical protein